MRIMIVERPSSYTTTLFSGAGELKDNIIKNNSVRFKVRHHTKTQLSLSVYSGTVSFTINSESEYSKENNLKFVQKIEMNFFAGRQEVHNYLKLSKKQDVSVLLNHIKSLTTGMLFKDLHIEKLIDREDFIIEVELPDDLMAISPLRLGEIQLCD